MSRKWYKRSIAKDFYENFIPEWAFIVNWKWKNKVYKLWIVDRNIPVLQLARFRSNKQKEAKMWIEKNGCKQGSSSQD